MNHFLLTFLLLLTLVAGARADTFAALTIIPAGSEQLDISTGITTLPEGGKVVDKERGLELESRFIRYEEGRYIETEKATVEGKFGSLNADTVRIDLESSQIIASGNLRLANTAVDVQAGELVLFLDGDVARLSGGVQSETPEFHSDSLLVAIGTSDAVLVSPYQFQDGPMTLRQDSAGRLLHLQQTLEDGEQLYTPSTTVETDLLALLTPYLP